MFCSKCNNPLNEGAQFCNKCGNKISSNIHHEPNIRQETTKNKKNILLPVLVGLIIVLSIVLVFLFMNKKPADFSQRYFGNIGTEANFILSLNCSGGELTGFYKNYCDSTKVNVVSGTLDNDRKIELFEIDAAGKKTLSFQGVVSENGNITGSKFYSLGGTSVFSFTINFPITGIPCEARPTVSEGKKSEDIKPVVINKPKSISFRVNGSDLNDLRSKLSQKSASLMSVRSYSPKNAKLNVSTLSFSCTLVPDTFSSFSKIGLYFGPRSNGFCESCDNVLLKNPGAKTLTEEADADYFYGVIAIPR